MRVFKLGSIVILLGALAACTGNAKAPDPAALEAAAAARLQKVPPADEQLSRKPAAIKPWRNPYLIVMPEGIWLLDPANSERRLLKPDEILQSLAALPTSAWPYGRVAGVVETADGVNQTEDQRVAIRRNKGILEGTLEGAHIAIHWIPST
jgi:hypothetical protein